MLSILESMHAPKENFGDKFLIKGNNEFPRVSKFSKEKHNKSLSEKVSPLNSIGNWQFYKIYVFIFETSFDTTQLLLTINLYFYYLW